MTSRSRSWSSNAAIYQILGASQKVHNELTNIPTEKTPRPHIRLERAEMNAAKELTEPIKKEFAYLLENHYDTCMFHIQMSCFKYPYFLAFKQEWENKN
tara:strand:- start:2695 stop:2991 length:297 start_codon:yes stop_codon:yes gene_type:complete